ncbi:VWA domain-containing protein [Larkinella soli]|uniref:VWA domain-containing protein n=1 Tax=Larkinella soli TaxID=1770527 RepID=UPI000FFB148A|nr:VWA domain-containing protein [Larkinella soli]
MKKSCLPIVGALLLSLLLTGCQSEQNRRTDRPSTPNTAPARTTTKSPAQGLEARWYADADRNAVPDFMEQELGYRPDAEDCAADASRCGPGAAGEELDFTVNTLLMLDASGSMAARIGSTTKMEAAKTSLARYASVVPEAVRLGFLLYGHEGANTEAGKAASCAGISLLAPIGAVNGETIQAALRSFQPTGWTPIAGALQKAKESFSGLEKKNNRIILVSDGIETCGGDPVAVAKELHDSGFSVTVDVIGFSVPGSDARQLRAIAEAGGGVYNDVRSQAELDAYFERQSRAFVKTIEAANCYLEVFNRAWICDAGLVNKALLQFNRHRQAFLKEGKQAEAETVLRLRAKADEAHQARKAKRAAFRQQAEKLRRDAFAINARILKAYQKIKPQ